MTRRASVLRLWLILGGIAVLLVAPLVRPFGIAWRCYARHAAAGSAAAAVVSKPEPGIWVLELHSGPHAGASCTAKPGSETAEVGETFAVAYLADTGECVPVSTVERSRVVLLALSAGIGCLFLLLFAIGLGIQHGLTRPGAPQRRMRVEPGAVPCPACGGKMAEGYVPLLAGIHWREPGEPIGLPHALGGLPGTVSWRARPQLHAFRCTSCEILALQYGAPRRDR